MEDRSMNNAVTVVQVLLGVIFIVGGLLRLAMPHTSYAKLPGQGWASEFKPAHLHLIGGLEVCAGIGLIVPLLLGSLTMLAPLAAVGIALVMSGAMATHLRRSEYPVMALNLTWLALALFVAYGRLVGFAV
jgi:uncharacterized membrane protein YphA (DoxX/SURF4 family)